MNLFYKLPKKIHILVAVVIARCMEVAMHYFRKSKRILFKGGREHDEASNLNLSGCGITNIMDFVTTRNCIRRLYLHNNQISKIPEGIVALGCLTTLSLDSNKLSEFPQVVCQLTTLRFLSLNCNNIRVLPSEIKNLKKLENLFLNKTGLEYIPEQIGGCKNLMGIVARKNCIQRLPESLGLLNQLTWLNFEENKITELPQSFNTLTKLKDLNLGKNRLSSFPDVVNDIRSIELCFLEDNCIETITPRQIGLSAFMQVLDITNNPAASSEELVSIFPHFTHVVYKKLDDDLDLYGNEVESDFDGISESDTPNESGDENEIV